jgi:thioredoxin reductase (NADPH)
MVIKGAIKMSQEYDVVIIGAGPAGLTAGIYCGRAGLKPLIAEKTAVGGQILKTDIIENYPGFPNGMSGFELIEEIRKQAEKFNAEFVSEEVSGIDSRSPDLKFKISTSEAKEYLAKAVIVSSGANPKRLGIKGEAELYGKGISYCATCDGPFYKDKEIAVIGGGDAAVGEAVYLTRFAKKLILVHRRNSLRASKVLQDRLLSNGKVEVKWDSIVTEIIGNNKISGIKVKNLKIDGEEEIPVDGVFIYVGLEPNTDFLKGIAELDDKGFVLTNEEMRTSMKGVFACGDVRKNMLKQVVTACAEGAIAAHACCRYIEELKD